MSRVSFAAVQFPDIVVELDGQELRVPGDIPIPDMIAIDEAARAALGDSEEDSGEAVLRLYELLLELFRIRQPDLERLPVGPRGLLPLALGVLNPEAVKTAARPDPTRPRPRAGTKKRSATSSRSRTKTASRARSAS